MVGMGLTQMNSLLSSANTMESISNLGAQRTMLKGEKGVLGAQIETDKERGIDTADKEERYATIGNNETAIMERIDASASELNERIAKDNEKIREEEDTKTKAAEKAEKAAEASKSGKTAGSGAPAPSTDTVDISVFAQHAAASAPPAVPEIPTEQTANVGEVLDVKA